MEMTLETGAIVNVNFKYQSPTPPALHHEPKSINNSSKSQLQSQQEPISAKKSKSQFAVPTLESFWYIRWCSMSTWSVFLLTRSYTLAQCKPITLTPTCTTQVRFVSFILVHLFYPWNPFFDFFKVVLSWSGDQGGAKWHCRRYWKFSASGWNEILSLVVSTSLAVFDQKWNSLKVRTVIFMVGGAGENTHILL